MITTFRTMQEFVKFHFLVWRASGGVIAIDSRERAFKKFMTSFFYAYDCIIWENIFFWKPKMLCCGNEIKTNFCENREIRQLLTLTLCLSRKTQIEAHLFVGRKVAIKSVRLICEWRHHFHYCLLFYPHHCLWKCYKILNTRNPSLTSRQYPRKK